MSPVARRLSKVPGRQIHLTIWIRTSFGRRIQDTVLFSLGIARGWLFNGYHMSTCRVNVAWTIYVFEDCKRGVQQIVDGHSTKPNSLFKELSRRSSYHGSFPSSTAIERKFVSINFKEHSTTHYTLERTSLFPPFGLSALSLTMIGSWAGHKVKVRWTG